MVCGSFLVWVCGENEKPRRKWRGFSSVMWICSRIIFAPAAVV